MVTDIWGRRGRVVGKSRFALTLHPRRKLFPAERAKKQSRRTGRNPHPDFPTRKELSGGMWANYGNWTLTGIDLSFEVPSPS